MKILVVDDCADTADLVVEVLSTLGHDVAAAYGGLELMSVLSETSVAAVLLDLRMPGMDGYEVLNWLRSRYPRSELRVIALTGCADEEAVAKMRAHGFDAILIKPVSVEAIASALESYAGLEINRALT